MHITADSKIIPLIPQMTPQMVQLTRLSAAVNYPGRSLLTVSETSEIL